MSLSVAAPAQIALPFSHSQLTNHLTELFGTEESLQNASASQDLETLILDIRPKIEMGKEYSFLAAAILCEKLRLETLSTLSSSTLKGLAQHARELHLPHGEKTESNLSDYLTFGIAQGHLSARLAEFDIGYLQSQIRHERNGLFDYLGAHTLYDRYLLHKQGSRYESFQNFWMRVSMGIALAEFTNGKTAQFASEKAAEFYHCISQMLYVPSTPTLFNAGTARSQMSSCFLTTTQDDLVDIYRQYSDNALLSKFAGGLGNDWTQVRASGSWIQGTNGRSQGVIPFIKVQDSSTIAVNQGGKRKGAVCAYLETFHLDIEDFLELRKNTGDERRRTHDMNTSNWVPDLFLERVEAGADWTLFCPSDCPELHNVYGAEFKRCYETMEARAKNGEIKNFKVVSAVALWRKMLTMLFETGHPWITFKDPCNLRSPQRHAGVVHSSNLCTEITLNTSETETAVCNIGSVNLKAIFASEQPYKTLAKTVAVAMRMLDNVITENFYPIQSAATANNKHRPVGLGLMGFQDVLYKKRIPYTHKSALGVSEKIMESIAYHAIQASAHLAQERGSYESFVGSSWSQGLVPQDTLELLGAHVKTPVAEEGLDSLTSEGFGTFDWNSLRAEVKLGMRNSLTMAIAPTATISNIAGCCQSIEPSYKNLYVKSNLGGDYTVINEYLVDDLKALGLWNSETARQLKISDGSILNFELSEELKELYQTAFDIEPEQLIRCAAVRQKYIDQAQSLNLYLAGPSGRRLDEMYRYAWHSGLKTTYYLRTKAASSVEKSSVKLSGASASAKGFPIAGGIAASSLNSETQLNSDIGTSSDFSNVFESLNAAGSAKLCSIENPECESCQ
jgi:ribonucleoside-diphosphate reductase alpha chain